LRTSTSKEIDCVYLVTHLLEFRIEHPLMRGLEYEDVRIVGVFSSLKNARLAVKKLLSKPGFRDAPKGFHIERWMYGRIEWAEGYGVI
jgi:hypothetical protein